MNRQRGHEIIRRVKADRWKEKERESKRYLIDLHVNVNVNVNMNMTVTVHTHMCCHTLKYGCNDNPLYPPPPQQNSCAINTKIAEFCIKYCNN